jgi:hypothetical protein
MGGMELDSGENSLEALMETLVPSYSRHSYKESLKIYEGCSRSSCGKEVKPARVDGSETIFPEEI